MHRRGRRIAVALACAAALSSALGGCGGSKDGGDGGGANPRVVDVRVVDGARAPSVSKTATAVANRLRRLGVQGAVVSARRNAIRIEAPNGVDPFALEAATRADPVVVRPVTKAEPPPCRVAKASGSAPPAIEQAVRLPAPALGRFCLTLGAGVSLGTAVSSAEAITRPSLGWTVAISLSSPDRARLSTALAPFSLRDVVLAAGRDVISRFVSTAGAPSLQSAIEGNFSEWEARRVAAALVVSDSLPSRLAVPTPPVPSGPRVDIDVWSAALGVTVCGEWLANVPSFEGTDAANTGLHSHGDGLVAVHPYADPDAGDRATLGRFFAAGGWKLGSDRIEAWDGAVHRNGDRCSDGGVAKVRYTVDGVEGTGDPAAVRLENRAVIVLAFEPARTPVGAPPQAGLLRQPRWVPATTP